MQRATQSRLKFFPYMLATTVFLFLLAYLLFFYYPVTNRHSQDDSSKLKLPIFIGTSIILLPEYGISMHISDDLKDLVYIVYPYENGEFGLYFSTKSLMKTDSNCSADIGAIGGISRIPAPWDKEGEYTQATQLGNYYYIWTHTQNPCTSLENEQANLLQEKLSDQLGQAFQTLKIGQ